jgi:hypothetical protein
MEYRDDDLKDEGYCPQCFRNLGQLTKEAKGFCEIHGWVFAEFRRPQEEEDDDE